MTNNEAITWLRGIREQFTGNCTTDTLVPISRCDIQAIGLAIKALEERPQGKWIESHICSCGKILRTGMNVIEHKCKNCGRWSITWERTITDNFCSNCGARMKIKK